MREELLLAIEQFEEDTDYFLKKVEVIRTGLEDISDEIEKLSHNFCLNIRNLTRKEMYERLNTSNK